MKIHCKSSEFDRCFTDFALAEPVAMYMHFLLAQIYVDVDGTASKIGSLTNLDTAAAENEILTLQNDIQMKCDASERKGEFYIPLEKHLNIRM